MVLNVPELIGGGLLLVILNIAFWAFAWGRTVGKVCEAVDNLEQRFTTHETNHHSHEVLPSCQDIFKSIEGRLSSVEAKIDIIIERE